MVVVKSMDGRRARLQLGGQVRTTSISPFKQCWGPVGMGMGKNRMGRDLRVVIGI